jgi:subtilase family serine protease
MKRTHLVLTMVAVLIFLPMIFELRFAGAQSPRQNPEIKLAEPQPAPVSSPVKVDYRVLGEANSVVRLRAGSDNGEQPILPETYDEKTALSVSKVIEPNAGGLTIIPTFDSSITTNANAPAIEAMINNCVVIYQSLFKDPITVQILFRYSTTDPNGQPMNHGARSNFNLFSGPWDDFVNRLKADAMTSNDGIANSSLPSGPLSPGVVIKSANARALGIDIPPQAFPGFSGTYDGIITLDANTPWQFTRPPVSNRADAQQFTEHEIDEVLGLGSSVNRYPDLSPQDFFSWSSAGNRNTTASGRRYFSIDGGVTDIVNFNQDPGGDFGDWESDSSCTFPNRVQNAVSCGGVAADISATSPEGINLDVIGYDLVSGAPSPSPSPSVSPTPGIPNLTPYQPTQPSVWSDKIVVSNTTGTSTDSSPLRTTDTLYVDWAVLNNGTATTSSTFQIRLLVDGVERISWTSNPLAVSFYTFIQDYSIGSLTAGTHTIKIVADSLGSVAESNETDNEYTKTISVVNSAQPNLTPVQPSGWSDKIVVSTATGTNTDSATLRTTDTLVVDWAVINNGSAAVSSSFSETLYVDGVAKQTFTTSPPLNVNGITGFQDYSIGSLSAGIHTIKIVADSGGVIAESNETDNEYSKAITVIGIPNLTPVQPTGWSDKIVVSTVTGTNIDSTVLRSTDTLFLDWAVINNGTAAITSTFNETLYIDGIIKQVFTTSPPLNTNAITGFQDYSIGSLAAGVHTIKIVADSGSAIAESNEADNEYTKTITVAGNVQVTIQTNPVGRSFAVDGTTFSSTQTFSWVPGSSHTIAAGSPQSGGTGTQFAWNSWSDAGAISHMVSPTTATTYTANFNTQFMLTMSAGSGGTVSPASGFFNSGQPVSISAIPNTNFAFTGWTGTGTGSFTGATNPATVTMNSPITETAAFAAVGTTLQFSSATYTVNEGGGFLNVTIGRSGNASSAASIAYATSNGTAKEGKDYVAASGVLNFAAGETSKTFPVLVVDNAFVDLARTVNLTLSSPSGASLGTTSSATLTVIDNDLVLGVNPVDQQHSFVQFHYYDFFGRYPDQSGWDFWTNTITSCGTSQSCTDVKRINASGAFFLSIEFQETGYLVYRIYKSAFGNIVNAPVPVRFEEFLPDTEQIGSGVVVNQGNWQAQLEANKVAFTQAFVQRSRFTAAYPTTMTPAAFVDQLFSRAGVTPSTTQRNMAIAEFGATTNTTDTNARARALRDVAENPVLNQQEFNRAFVLMQYFGYLRRNPYDAPESTRDYSGYTFWLGKLNQFNGDYIAAEMVKAFIASDEYRHRFGP